eukprot:365682-Chlamydomonas_euryale.AAC.27
MLSLKPYPTPVRRHAAARAHCGCQLAEQPALLIGRREVPKPCRETREVHLVGEERLTSAAHVRGGHLRREE